MLHLDKGIFRVFHEISGWRTLGSFTVSGDQIKFFNDPHCTQVVGIYTWKLEEGKLVFEVVEDECFLDLRAVRPAAPRKAGKTCDRPMSPFSSGV